MKEKFYWLNILVPLHSQPIRAKTKTKRDSLVRVLTHTDSANELKCYTLYLLNSLSSSGDTLVICLQCLKKCSC